MFMTAAIANEVSHSSAVGVSDAQALPPMFPSAKAYPSPFSCRFRLPCYLCAICSASPIFPDLCAAHVPNP